MSEMREPLLTVQFTTGEIATLVLCLHLRGMVLKSNLSDAPHSQEDREEYRQIEGIFAKLNAALAEAKRVKYGPSPEEIQNHNLAPIEETRSGTCDQGHVPNRKCTGGGLEPRDRVFWG